MTKRPVRLLFAWLAVCALLPSAATAQAWLSDRGAGIPTSTFGLYLQGGELVIFPFYERAGDKDLEYQPSRFGAGPDIDYRARFRSTQRQLFIGYGISDRLAVMVEGSMIEATFDKSPDDTYTSQARIEESGLADLEGEVRWRIRDEDERRPEIFGYLEVTAPSQKDKLVIGDDTWDFRPGVGLLRGFHWGTLLVRTDLEYNRGDKHLDIGELAIEYLKRLSPAWQIYLALEGGEGGAPDEWVFVTGLYWQVTGWVSLRLDNPQARAETPQSKRTGRSPLDPGGRCRGEGDSTGPLGDQDLMSSNALEVGDDPFHLSLRAIPAVRVQLLQHGVGHGEA